GASEVEWVARRLLARMHSYSRRARRQAHEPVTAREFMRFLLAWQHVAPDTQLYGEQGLLAVLEQLQGFETAAAAWESEVFRRRLRNYDPAWLDGLCHAGEVAWLRLTPRTPDDTLPRGASAPSKATPTSVVLRGDLPWLVAATRSNLPPPAGATRGDLPASSVGGGRGELAAPAGGAGGGVRGPRGGGRPRGGWRSPAAGGGW